jgi:uncharacterized NAD(P)/FAD-binding protein YdhS
MTEPDVAPCAIFGCYIQPPLQTISHVERRQTCAQGCPIVGAQAVLDLADGTKLLLEAVVLAIGNFDPAPLRGVAEERIASDVYRHSAWEAATYANLPIDATVMLTGSGLTTVDVLLRLREAGHSGEVTTISRHGIFPHPHVPYQAVGAGVSALFYQICQ